MAIDILEDYINKVPFLELAGTYRDSLKALDKFLDTDSKKTRNRLAGYIAHIVEKEERLKTLKVSYQPVVDTRRKRARRRRK